MPGSTGRSGGGSPAPALKYPSSEGEPLQTSPLTDSNRRPSPYHGDALPTELREPWPAPLGAHGLRRDRRHRPPIMPRFRVRPNPVAATVTGVQVRPARPDDADAISRIFNHEVLTSVSVFELVPRSVAEQRAWLAERSGAMAVLVAEVDHEVVGFASLSPYRDRPAYRTTVEDSVYVDRDHHGSGLGRALLGALVQRATDHGFHTVIGRITADNTASIRLHEALGFEIVGHEREVGRKFGRWLDVVVVQLMLESSRR